MFTITKLLYSLKLSNSLSDHLINNAVHSRPPTSSLKTCWVFAVLYNLTPAVTCFFFFLVEPRTRFSKAPETFRAHKTINKISNLTITELLYSRILNMNRGSFRTRSFRRIQFSVFRYRRNKNGLLLRTRKVSEAFEKRALISSDFVRLAN